MKFRNNLPSVEEVKTRTWLTISQALVLNLQEIHEMIFGICHLKQVLFIANQHLKTLKRGLKKMKESVNNVSEG